MAGLIPGQEPRFRLEHELREPAGRQVVALPAHRVSIEDLSQREPERGAVAHDHDLLAAVHAGDSRKHLGHPRHHGIRGFAAGRGEVPVVADSREEIVDVEEILVRDPLELADTAPAVRTFSRTSIAG